MELERKAIDRASALEIALLLQPVEEHRVQPALEISQSCFEARDKRGNVVGPPAALERGTPHLAARSRIEAGEEIGEACQQIALGDEQMKRRIFPVASLELLHSIAELCRVARCLLPGPVKQIGHAQLAEEFAQGHVLDGGGEHFAQGGGGKG